MNTSSPLPPQTFGARLLRIGPGMLLAAAAIGSGELILTPRAGALYGLSVGWVILVSILYKLALTLGLARYTIATGEDIFEGFSHLPGPRNWFVGVLVAVFLLGAVGYSGIALACGSALFALCPALSMIQWAVLVVGAVFLLLLRGAYGAVEKVAFALALTLIAGVLYSLAVLNPAWSWVVHESVPRMPPGSGQTLISLLGWTAGGVSTLIYSFWILEKGYAIPRGDLAVETDGCRSKEDFQQWLSVARMDALLSYAMMMVVSLAFLAIGSITLGTAGPDGGPLVPSREETTSVLSRMLTEAAGPRARYIFLVAALAILSSTVLGCVDGKARGLRTAVHLIAPRSRRWSDPAWYRLGISLLCLIIFALLFTGEPVVLIMLTSALEAPVLSLSAVMLVYLLHTRLPREYRPGVAWHIVIVAGTVTYFALSIQALVTTIAGFRT
ncbi:MAG: Nramp family divalent metal transporter [Pirellulales bacterium]|nr:Nramp family divalent metal transporter [Pirellulales bacterium]